MNTGVLYRCNPNCQRILEVATDCLLWLAPTARNSSGSLAMLVAILACGIAFSARHQ
jgi:hypothetical protein